MSSPPANPETPEVITSTFFAPLLSGQMADVADPSYRNEIQTRLNAFGQATHQEHAYQLQLIIATAQTNPVLHATSSAQLERSAREIWMRRYQSWVAGTSRLQGGVPVLPDEFHRPRPLGFLVRVLNTIRPAQPDIALVEARTRHLNIIDASISIFFDVMMEFRAHWAGFQTGTAQEIGQDGHHGPSTGPDPGPGPGGPTNSNDPEEQSQAEGSSAGAYPHLPPSGNQAADGEAPGQHQVHPAGMVYREGDGDARRQLPSLGDYAVDGPNEAQHQQERSGTTYQQGIGGPPSRPAWAKAAFEAFVRGLNNHALIKHHDPTWALLSDENNGIHSQGSSTLGYRTSHGQVPGQAKRQLGGMIYQQGGRRSPSILDAASSSVATQQPIGVIGERAGEAEENVLPVVGNSSHGSDDKEDDNEDDRGDEEEESDDDEYKDDKNRCRYQAPSRTKSRKRSGLRTLFSSYPKGNTPLPLGITLGEICQGYPNHLHGRVLDQFREAKWNGHEIWDACRPNGRLNNQITGSQVRPWNYLEGRMRRAKLQSEVEQDDAEGDEEA